MYLRWHALVGFEGLVRGYALPLSAFILKFAYVATGVDSHTTSADVRVSNFLFLTVVCSEDLLHT